MHDAAIHEEMQALRRRLNGLAAQQTAALALSTGIIAATVLILTALRGGSNAFTVVSALAGATAVSTAVILTWRLRRRWLSLAAAAHLADQRSALDGRLVTLLADPAPSSPLRPLLLQQIEHATPRWRVDQLAPRRVAPATMLVPATLLLCGATLFLLRPPATAIGYPQPVRPVALDEPGDALVSHATAVASLHSTERGAGQDGRHGDGGATGGSQPGDSPLGDAPLGLGSHGDTPSSAPGSATGAARSDGDGLRQAIRRAMGADPAEHRADSGRQSGPAGADARHPDSNGQPETSGDQNGTADGHPREQAPDRTERPPSTLAERGAEDPTHPTGELSERGTAQAGRGSDAGDLFAASAGHAAATASGTQPMAVQLGAFAVAAPQYGEPQRRGGQVESTTTASAPAGPLPDLAAAQSEDAVTQKLAIAPEHEAIVRRLFTRQ